MSFSRPATVHNTLHPNQYKRHALLLQASRTCNNALADALVDPGFGTSASRAFATSLTTTSYLHRSSWFFLVYLQRVFLLRLYVSHIDMKSLRTLIPAFLAASPAAAMPSAQLSQQAILRNPLLLSNRVIGVGHFSEWSRATKKAFLVDWQAGKASEWTIVEGNEGGMY